MLLLAISVSKYAGSFRDNEESRGYQVTIPGSQHISHQVKVHIGGHIIVVVSFELRSVLYL
jgi:hypothetical protein